MYVDAKASFILNIQLDLRSGLSLALTTPLLSVFRQEKETRIEIGTDRQAMPVKRNL